MESRRFCGVVTLTGWPAADGAVVSLDAIVEASTIRLRPIIMTALATVMGAMPLVVSSGAGYEGRRAIGVVIVFGVSFASFITLLVVPVFYQLWARNTGSPGRLAEELRDYEKSFPRSPAVPSGEDASGPAPAE